MGGSTQKLTPRRRPRRCVGCGEELSKAGLLRVVRSPNGTIAIDPTSKAPGRGAYLCRNAECVRLAKKRNALSRALRHPVGGELYTQLEAFCAEDAEPGD